MSESILLRFCACLAGTCLLTHCSSNEASSACANAANCIASGGSAGSGAPFAGAPSNGGAIPAAGGAQATSSGGMVASAGAMSSGGMVASAGAMSSGGAVASGGATATGGTTSSGGAAVAGGASSTTGGASATGGTPAQAGATASGGTTSSGGTSSAGGTSTGGSGPIVDKNGVPLAKPGDSKTGSREYLNFGDFRLLLNKWGSDELGCNTTMKVFANSDKSFGWSFDRGACGGNKQKPDYPEIEFGIHPFGAGSSLATTPSFSSTTVLPLQIKDIASASVILDNLNVSIQKATTWNIDFELWLSQKNPVTEANPGVYAELITFWGWKDDWACDKSGSVTAGDKSYTLCHQDDNWANGKWRYFQLRANGGPYQSFNGKIDVKALLDWLVGNYGYSRDLWVSRFEVGSEIDDDTAGSVSLKNITFQVNGTSKSAEFAQ
jgi:hypothetical protein